MSARGLKATLAAVVLAAIISAPIVAFAANAPSAGGTLDLQAWPENGTLVVVTALTIPGTTKLPVTVRVPVPAGAQIQWAGEILGGDPAADPTRVYKVKKSPAGGQYAEFTAETTRVVQVDSYLPVLKTDGANTSATFDWIQSVNAPSETFSMRVPKGATNVVLTPKPSGAPETNAAGETLYSGDTLQLAAGSTTPVSIAYATGAAPVGATAAGGTGQSLLYFAFALLVVVAGVLVVIVVKQQKPGGSSVSEDASSTDRRRKKAQADEDPADAEQSPADKDADSDDWGFVDGDE